MREAKTFSRAILAGPAEALPSADPVLIALAEYERQRAATDIALKAYEIAAEAGDFKEAEQRFGEANTAAFFARDAAFKSQPTTTPGALALLRLVEASVAELGHCLDNQPSLIAAIRAAAEAIEQEAGR